MSFKISDNVNGFNAGCRQGEITACFQDLVQVLGEPVDRGFDKVSGEWLLHGPDGQEVTIYDYKCTDLYEDGMPTVEEFREQEYAEFSVGGLKEVDAILLNEWLAPLMAGKRYTFISESEYRKQFMKENALLSFNQKKSKI